MSRLTPVSWQNFVKRMRQLGFEEPYTGGKHPQMRRGEVTVIIPNPHQGDISVGLIEVYNQNAATHQVYAEITGVKASDRSPISGKFFNLGTEGSEFIVTDGKGVYKTGQQILTSKLTTEVGEAATTQVRTLTFNDQEAHRGADLLEIASLQQLQSA